MSFSNQYELGVLSNFIGAVALPQPTELNVALSLATPDEDGTGISEPSGGGYARVNSYGSWTIGADDGNASTVTNSIRIAFPEATASWGRITHIGLFHGAEAGSFVGYAALQTPRDVPAGVTVEFAVGALVVKLD